jgi:hypothetical protein
MPPGAQCHHRWRPLWEHAARAHWASAALPGGCTGSRQRFLGPLWRWQCENNHGERRALHSSGCYPLRGLRHHGDLVGLIDGNDADILVPLLLR